MSWFTLFADELSDHLADKTVDWLLGKSNSDILLEGKVGYEMDNSDNTIRLYADKIKNQRGSGTSGTLKISLFASEDSYDINNSTVAGYTLAEIRLDPLEGGWSYQDFSKWADFSNPPSGAYYINIFLEEYNTSASSNWFILDNVEFDQKHL